MARAKNALADEALLAGAIGVDPRKGAPARAAHALARQHPDAVIGPNGHAIGHAQAVQRAEKRAAVARATLGQDDAEATPHSQGFLDDRG